MAFPRAHRLPPPAPALPTKTPRDDPSDRLPAQVVAGLDRALLTLRPPADRSEDIGSARPEAAAIPRTRRRRIGRMVLVGARPLVPGVDLMGMKETSAKILKDDPLHK